MDEAKEKRQEDIYEMPDSLKRILKEARQHAEDLYLLFDVLIRRHEGMEESIDILSHQVAKLREKLMKEAD